MAVLTRRKFFTLLGGVAAGAGGGGYVHWGEPRWLEVTRRTVALGAEARPPLRLLQLSDFHASPVVPFERRRMWKTTGMT